MEDEEVERRYNVLMNLEISKLRVEDIKALLRLKLEEVGPVHAAYWKYVAKPKSKYAQK